MGLQRSNRDETRQSPDSEPQRLTPGIQSISKKVRNPKKGYPTTKLNFDPGLKRASDYGLVAGSTQALMFAGIRPDAAWIAVVVFLREIRIGQGPAGAAT